MIIPKHGFKEFRVVEGLVLDVTQEVHLPNDGQSTSLNGPVTTYYIEPQNKYKRGR